MRRMRAMLTVCLCAAAGCQGGGAQEPYHGVIAAAQRPVDRAPVSVPRDAEPQMATEVDAPWSIALLSNAKTALVKKPAKVLIVDARPAPTEPDAHELDLQLASDPAAEEKTAAPKTCTGVVIRRS